MRALLDVNVLIALLDGDHVDHRTAREWLAAEIRHGWASCPITQNGFVRVVSQPRYPAPVSPAAAIERLARATATGHHRFWSCDVTILDPDRFDSARLLGPKQVTDCYLLALAATHRGRFVTFDRNVPLEAVDGAKAKHLLVL